MNPFTIPQEFTGELFVMCNTEERVHITRQPFRKPEKEVHFLRELFIPKQKLNTQRQVAVLPGTCYQVTVLYTSKEVHFFEGAIYTKINAQVAVLLLINLCIGTGKESYGNTYYGNLELC